MSATFVVTYRYRNQGFVTPRRVEYNNLVDAKTRVHRLAGAAPLLSDDSGFFDIGIHKEDTDITYTEIQTYPDYPGPEYVENLPPSLITFDVNNIEAVLKAAADETIDLRSSRLGCFSGDLIKAVLRSGNTAATEIE